MAQIKQTEILINYGLHEIRVALLENSILQEVYIERQSNLGLVGNIYKGRVERVLPGMDAAFVDIGLEKNAFLHVKNISPRQPKIQKAVVTKKDDKVIESHSNRAKITDYLRQSDTILVQVLKDPMGNKGARLSTDISIASRYVVYLPQAENIGISTRIESEETRMFLRERIEKLTEDLPGGYIVRTAIEKADAWALYSDIQYLQKIWVQIQKINKESEGENLIYQGLPLHLRCLRDLVDENLTTIRVDSVAIAKEMKTFAQDFFPENTEVISTYQSERPIFDLFSVEDEIEKALKRKVFLKSGGYIIIDQTEAMTTIDVNTGKFVGASNQEETIFKTNLEATKSIARQLRLRNLGGIIIIDFIDMGDGGHRESVMASLINAMDETYSRYAIESLSTIGLVQMTRKRTRESLGHILCETCPSCDGRGYVKTIETIALEVTREVMREAAQFKPQRIMVICAHEIDDYLSDEQPNILADLEETLNIPITLKNDHAYSREQYDIAIY